MHMLVLIRLFDHLVVVWCEPAQNRVCACGGAGARRRDGVEACAARPRRGLTERFEFYGL